MDQMSGKWCPLGDEHCALLSQVCASCVGTGEVLDKLDKAGLDVSDRQSRNDGQYDLASKLKAAFFPDRP